MGLDNAVPVVTCRQDNPLLLAWEAFQRQHPAVDILADGVGYFARLTAERDLRNELRRRYAFAIPTDEAIDAVASLGGVVEIGAGRGYWAALIERAHGPGRLDRTDRGVVAYDDGSWVMTSSPDHPRWHAVVEGGPERAADHPDRALFLCWPPYNEPMAADALRAYRGRDLAFVGEGPGGCTADDEFFAALTDEWSLVRRVVIPQWDGLHDELTVWRRTGPSGGGDR